MMPDNLRTWLEETRRKRDAAQLALQKGDHRAMVRWALEYGHLLLDTCEALAEELEHSLAHKVRDGRCSWCGRKDGHAPGCWVGGAQATLRVPGGGES